MCCTVQIPEGAEAMKPAAKQPITLSTAPPRKASKAEASIRITADASKQPQKDAIDKAPPAAGEAAKPQMPVLPRPAAPGAAAAKKDEPNVLTMPRDEAWPRLLAYEVCDRNVADCEVGSIASAHKRHSEPAFVSFSHNTFCVPLDFITHMHSSCLTMRPCVGNAGVPAGVHQGYH